MNTTRRLAAISLLTCASFSPAHAATFCVSTGTQLANALVTSNSNGANDEIKIVSGTLTGSSQVATNPRWRILPEASDEASTLIVSGGWSTGNNCSTQTQQADLTVLDAAFEGAALDIRHATPTFSGQITIRNLTLTRGRSYSSGAASGLNARIVGSLGAQLIIENVFVVAAQTTVSQSGGVSINVDSGGFVRFRNNTVHSNTFTAQQAGSAVSISATAPAVAYVSNNSIFDNTSTIRAGSGLALAGVINATNNAVADNTSTDVSPLQEVYSYDATSMTLRNNHFESAHLLNPFLESGTTDGDPLWTGVGMVRIPDAVSPLRNSGINSPSGGIPAIDIRGDARIVSGTIDRGAVEAVAVAVPLTDAIFSNGFN